jgi:hypothetical protein
MTALAHVVRRLPLCTPVRRRAVSLAAIAAIATSGVSTTRPAYAPTAVEYAVVIAALIVVATTVPVLFFEHLENRVSQGAALSCPVFSGSGTLLGEDDCAWAKAAGQLTNQSGASGNTSVLRIGGQKQVAPDWFVGGAFGVGSLWAQSGNGSVGNGQLFDGSLSLKHTMGPWLFAGAVSFSSNAMHLAPAGSGLAGDANIYGGGVRLRGAYDFAFAGWYLRPRLDLDVTHIYRPGFQLSGPGPAGFGAIGVSVDGFSKTQFVATPMLELGGRFDTESKVVAWPYVAVGASFLTDSGSTMSASFVGPAGVSGGLQSTGSSPSVLGNVEAGLQLYRLQSFEMKAEYTLSVGDNFLTQSAGLRGALHF